jgi:hypothetical protein
MQPTIVLVNGAFAESASWNRIAERVHAAGHPVVAAANPLRGVADDAGDQRPRLHHRGTGRPRRPLLWRGGDLQRRRRRRRHQRPVYVAAFAPAPGESCIELSQRFPGSTLGDALQPIPRRDGTIDVLIARDRFHARFCADLPAVEAELMSVTRRPVALAALEEEAGPGALWRHVPSFFVIPAEDRNIAPALQRSLAERADARHRGAARQLPRRRCRVPPRRPT